MEIIRNDDRHDVRARVVIQMEIEEVSTAQEQTAQKDDVLKSLTPLINSMRLFGLYFSRKSRVAPDTQSQPKRRSIKQCRDWNFAKIYAIIILAVAWINAVRGSAIFDSRETVGTDLISKLAIIPSILLTVLLHTSYYVASHTGSLDRVFCQVDLSTTALSSKFSRRAKALTVICWTLIAANVIVFIALISLGRDDDDHLGELSLVDFLSAFHITGALVHVVRFVFIILQLQFIASWLFPQAMNYIVMRLLYDQFDKLSEEFSRCVGDRGEFSGDFEQFRRRHQAVCRSVQEADQFLMISIGATFFCQIFGIVFILYSILFYPQAPNADISISAVFVFFLTIHVFSLLLAALLAIIVNHKAHKLADRIHDIDLDSVDVKTASKIIVFLNRLNGEPIGVTVLGIFVIDKNTILAILGVLVTYFVVVVQFANPASCTSATPAAATNRTTEDLAYSVAYITTAAN